VDGLKKLIEFLDRLDGAGIYYQLNKIRDSILVEITVPGQRWEVEFMEDGSIEIEKFMTQIKIYDEKELEALFRDFSD
jgi:hypothetical protein